MPACVPSVVTVVATSQIAHKGMPNNVLCKYAGFTSSLYKRQQSAVSQTSLGMCVCVISLAHHTCGLPYKGRQGVCPPRYIAGSRRGCVF